MSAKKLDLSHPLVLGAVVVGLAVVIVINVRTFGGRRSSRAKPMLSSRMVSTEGRDALEFLADAVSSGSLAYAEAPPASPQIDWPQGLRDPFGATAVASETAVETTESTATEDNTLRCDAVLLQGPDPVALISGRPCRLGEDVAGAVVRAIDTTGVTLERDGLVMYLAVRETIASEAAYQIIMGRNTMQAAANTAAEPGDTDGGIR